MNKKIKQTNHCYRDFLSIYALIYHNILQNNDLSMDELDRNWDMLNNVFDK